MGKVVHHCQNMLRPLPYSLRGVATHQTLIATPILNWPQRRQLRSGAVKKFTFNKKVDKISFEWKKFCFAFLHFNNFFVTHGHISAMLTFLDLILSELSHSKSPQHSKTYLQKLETKTETHFILQQRQGNLFHFSQKGQHFVIF